MNLLMILAIISTSQNHGINLGIGSTGEASVGYQKGIFSPYLTMAFTSVSGTYTYFFQSYNDVLPEPYKEKIDGDTISWKIGLISPKLGTRISLNNKSTKPFVNLSVNMPIPIFISLKADDSTDQAQFDSIKTRLYEKPEPTITLSAGIGIEKFLGERFSIAAEINYNYLFGGMWLQDRYEENSNQTYWEKEQSHIKYQIGRTSTAIWLNYYF